MSLAAPHLGYVAAAYGVAALVFAALVLALVLDHRAQRRRVSELERAGARRRGDAT